MKLLEITRPSEGVNTELSNVLQYFGPKGLRSVLDSGGIKFGGQVLFGKGGDYTDWSQEFIENGKARIEDMEFSVSMESFEDDLKYSVKVLDDDEDDEEHTEAIRGAEENIKNGRTSEYNHNRDTGLDYEAKADDSQPEFFGYRDDGERIFIGFDVWIRDDEFNDEWDTQFKRSYGVEFDHEDETHQKIFDRAWKEYQNEYAMWGVMLEFNKRAEVVDEQAVQGGFHKNRSSLIRGDVKGFWSY